jgi:Rrf2 family nitric oxide-sensitive transcriptional repressor
MSISRIDFLSEASVFSQTVEYALRAVVHLADHSPSPRTTDQIAAATLVPKPYLSKVIQGLCAAQILQSKRGVGGGVALVKSPSELTILDVVNAVEPIARIRQCPLGLKTHGLRLCPLHKRMDNALAMVEAAFRQTTLAEVLAEPTSSRPLCELPTGKKSR